MTSKSLSILFFCVAALSAAWVVSAFPMQVQDDELVMEFRRFYTPSRSSREKVEAIYVLKGADTIAAVDALTRAFDDKDLLVRQAVVDTIGTFKKQECAQFLIDRFILERRVKKHRVYCAVECLGLMGNDCAAQPLLELFERARSWEEKSTIGVALGRLKSEKCIPALNLLLADSDPTLRIIALDAMAYTNKPEAPLSVPETDDDEPEPCKSAIIHTMEKDTDWQVRAAAIAAIRKMRFKDGIQPLINRLREEEGRLKGDAYEVLKEMTFSQYEDDPDQWQRYWDRVKDEFEVADLDAVIEARRKRKEQGTRYSAPTASFAGIPTQSRKIVFVIDISGSMETQVTEIDRFRDGGRDYSSFQRLEIVKQELVDTISSFDKTVRFNILAFASDLNWWKKRLVIANILNKNSADHFVKRLKPIGGASAGFRARAGLKAVALDKGKTNTYGALMASLGAPEDQDEKVGRNTYKEEVDTIYFLSDGQPTVGKTVDQREIRQAVRRVNLVRKVVIHTIAIGDFQKNFMKYLASENGGVYVDLGK